MEVASRQCLLWELEATVKEKRVIHSRRKKTEMCGAVLQAEAASSCASGCSCRPWKNGCDI